MLEFIISFSITLFLVTLGVGIGYHRLLSHRSLKCHKSVEYFFVVLGYLGFQASPIWWAAMHRTHHRYSDQPLDPHAGLYGWRRSVYGWIFDKRYPDHVDKNVICPDLVNDPFYKFLDCNGDVQMGHTLNGFTNFMVRFGVLYFFGLPAALGSLLAGLLMQQITLWFNLLSHMPQLGYKNYDTADDSTNVPFLAVLTLGEGLHNNHHAVPGSANNQMKKGEIDVAWQVIRLMKKVGLIGWVNDGYAHRLESNLRIEDGKPVPVPVQVTDEPTLVS